MEENFARKLIEECFKSTAKFNSMLREAQENCTEEEFLQLQQGTALVLGYMLTEIINPTLKKFPDLQPDGFESLP